METVLNLLLVRFAVLALGVVVLVLAAFAVLVVLRRRGRIDSARRGAEQLARLGSQYLETRGRRGDVRGRRAGLGGARAHETLRRLADPDPSRGRGRR